MLINTDCRSGCPAGAATALPDMAGISLMAASIAHEVTQPLAAITLNAEAALRCFERDYSSTQLHAALRAILEATSQANAIVRSIRHLTAQVRGVSSSARFDHTLNQLFDQLDVDLRRHSIKVNVDLANASQRLRIDPVQLHQVLRNLFANAIESMHEVHDRPRELAIQAFSDSAGFLVVSISDTGAGLDPACAQRVFDPLYSTKPDGMGIGLAICRAIIASHGGRIWAAAGAGHGSVFGFCVPFEDQPAVPYP